MHRDFFGHAQVTEETSGFAVGGIALVAVDLDHRAGIEFRAVIGVVLVGVVRVYAMGIVGRDQQGLLDRAHEFVAFWQQAAQGLFEHRAIGAAGGAGTDFFMVVADQYAGFLGVAGEQCPQAGVAGQQVVQAGTGDKVAVQPDHGGVLGVVEAQLVVEHHIGVEAMFAGQLLGEHSAKIHPHVTRELREDRRQFVLGIDRPALVGFTVEMNRQVGNDRDGGLEVDQLAFDLAVAAKGDAPRQGQVAVEPGGEQGTAVDFDTQLPEALAL